MGAYYNEIDRDAVLILRALIADGVIADGDIDTRSITEIRPEDLQGYDQCHFFAGGGLWSVAARMAGWPDDRPLWTGSCPCQPFSVAGKGAGIDDPRHLWPDFLRLIGARRPPVVVGEQVAGKAGYGWLDGVRADLAGEGYASRGVDIPACAVDAPHIRQRLYWCAVADAEGIIGRPGLREGGAERNGVIAANGDGGRIILADANRGGRSGWQESAIGSAEQRAVDERVDAQGVTLGDAFGSRLEGFGGHGHHEAGRPIEDRSVAAPDGSDERSDMGDTNGGGAGSRPGDDGEMQGLSEAQCKPELSAALSWRATGAHRNGSWWADHDWLVCHDDKARRTQPGTPLLVDGLPGRVGLWRVAGNAISPVLAAEVLGALMDVAA